MLPIDLALLIGGLWFVAGHYAGNLDRIPVLFDDPSEDCRAAAPTLSSRLTKSRPPLFGSARTPEQLPPSVAAGGPSDAIIIARFADDRMRSPPISIPRDSWVDIPEYGRNEITTVWASGGPTLLIQTANQFTGVRINYYVAR